MSFAENLMTLRKQRGWSQEELGSQIKVTRQTVSKWEMGQSTPELEKLVELSKLFDMSLDQLVGLEEAGERPDCVISHHPQRIGTWSCGIIYEYVSPVKVFGLPLIHVRLGFGPKLAKGIIAVGNCAVGVVAIGGCSLGLISLGGVSAGLLFAFGGLSLGLIALGGVAIGGFALGGCAVGQWLAIGGGALSNYLAIGGGAVSRGLAIGSSAYGHIAVGKETAKGAFSYLQQYGYHTEDVWYTVKQEFPHMWGWVRNIIQMVLN